MPLSLNSYFLGVGTVVGALAFGFGGGVLLTNTAMKDSPPGQTRLERVARSEPAPAAVPQVVNAAVVSPQQNAPSAAGARENPVPPPAAQAPTVQPAAVAAAQTETPKVDAQREAERVKEAAPAQPAEPATQPAQAKLTDQAKQTEPREAEQGKTAERKPERQKRYAERKFREMTVVRTKQQRLEVVDEPEVVSEPQERHFDLFKMPGLFGRPDDRDQ